MKTNWLLIAVFCMLCAISKATFAQSCTDSGVWSCYYYPSGTYVCECVDSNSAPAQQCPGGQVLACRLDQHCDWECQCMDPADVTSWQSHGHDCSHGGSGGHTGWWHHWHGHYRNGENQFAIDDETSLGEVYPNPVSTVATIKFSLSDKQNVSVKIVDISGKVVFAFADKFFEKGSNEITWNAADVPDGIYFLHLDAEDFSAIQKISVIK